MALNINQNTDSEVQYFFIFEHYKEKYMKWTETKWTELGYNKTSDAVYYPRPVK